MNNVYVDPVFNLQTVPPLPPGGSLDKAVALTEVTIETARPIILTQDPEKAGAANHVYLTPTASINVYADDVTLSGPLSFPGRNVVIFTRILRAENDRGQSPWLSVDGAPHSDEMAKPKALVKGSAPPNEPSKVKVAKGKTGWTPKDHPTEMNGENGKPGEKGNTAGSVWICCQKTKFTGSEHKLTISARGGKGGDGQPGQEGADGANGVNGASIGDRLFMDKPEPGTNGGEGGRGGTGGTGGPGGKGGIVVFHCMECQPALTVFCGGGPGGAAGDGGKGGDGGSKGLGGRGGKVPSKYGTGWGPSGWDDVGPAPDGVGGAPGGKGNPGGATPDSLPGSSRVTWGDVDWMELIRVASLTQLQMAFERARADYLVTEPVTYALRLMAAAPVKDNVTGAYKALPDFVDGGKNLVLVGRSRDGLQIRIFDSEGRKVVDKSESQMTEELARFQLAMVDVLEAAGWASATALLKMKLKDQREALISQLCRITGLPSDTVKQLSDNDLTGKAGVTAFMLQMGIRDEGGLKGDLEGHRNTLIVEAAGAADYDGGYLQSLDNHSLVRAALTPKPKNKFVIRGGMVFLRDRLFGFEKMIPLRKQFEFTMEDVLAAGGWRTSDELSDLSPAEQRKALIEELSRVSNESTAQIGRLNDYDMIGRGAVAAFMLQSGVRDKGGLASGPLEGHRNTLIVEVAGRFGYDGGYLQGCDNHLLVRLALEPKPGNTFGIRGSLAALRDRVTKRNPEDRQALIALAAETAGHTDMWSSIGERMQWLLKLLGAASTDFPDKPANEHPQKELAKALQPSVWSAVNNHAFGLDYYGQSPRFVPRLSVEAYLTRFNESVAVLEKIEKQYNDYFAAWNDQTTATANLKTVLASTEDYTNFISGRVGKINTEMSNTKTSIGTYDTRRKNSLDAVQQALRKYDTQVRSAFGLSWNTFFNCLNQLGFANFSEPARSLQGLSKTGGLLKAGAVEAGSVIGGFAGAGAMVVGPVGMMLNEASSNVLNDYGQPVTKELLLTQIDVIEGDLDLRAELEQRNDGFLNAGDSKRLVVELNKFSDLCKQFYKSLAGTKDVRDSIEGYIQDITTRNRYIDYYNSLAKELLDLLGEQRKIKAQKDLVKSRITTVSNPGLPVMTTFMSALYERAKAQSLSNLYLAARAYSLWALEPYAGFFDAVRTPGAITSSQLTGAQSTFTSLILQRLEQGYGSKSFVPARENSEGSIGVVVVLSKDTHADFFDELIEEGEAEFELEPATRASMPPPTYAPTTAAWYGVQRPKFAADEPNPFHGKANVRLTKARPWIVGLKTGAGNHTVQLIHLGEEQFRRADDVYYPPRSDADKSEYVSHPSKPIAFSYDPAGLSWDPVKNTFTPGKIFADNVANAEDGDLGFPEPGANVSKSVYAPIGPFAKWKVVVPKEDNGERDWSDVQAIVIDFHVFKEVFDTNLGRRAGAGSGPK